MEGSQARSPGKQANINQSVKKEQEKDKQTQTTE